MATDATAIIPFIRALLERRRPGISKERSIWLELAAG